MNIDIKKVMPPVPKNQFEAIEQMNKAQQEVLEALHIMQSALDFPEMVEQNHMRMNAYLSKFCED